MTPKWAEEMARNIVVAMDADECDHAFEERDDLIACCRCGAERIATALVEAEARGRRDLGKVRDRYRRRYKSDSAYRAARNGQRHTLKGRARAVVRDAVRWKRLAKPSACEACLEEKPLHGHHDNYRKPLEVRWLCARCHGEIHREYRDVG